MNHDSSAVIRLRKRFKDAVEARVTDPPSRVRPSSDTSAVQDCPTPRLITPSERARNDTGPRDANPLRLACIRDKVGLPGLIANSPEMISVCSKGLEFADSGRPILITGEVGVGKNTLARAIHAASGRHCGPYREIQSVMLPDDLFTTNTAHARNPRAHSELEALIMDTLTNGTMLLEEIGDLSFPAQSALWRVLMRAPGPVHMIASTHRSLTQAVREGRFRSDLLYLLNEQHLTPPPLRDRADDLLPMAERFRQEFQPANQQVVGFAETSVDAMRRHRWPGNVRELRNRIERAMLVAHSAHIEIRDLGIPPLLTPA